MCLNAVDLPSLSDRTRSSSSVDWREDGPIEIRTAEGPVDRDAVYRFRHRVLGAEEGIRRGFTASSGRLLEPADVDAEILAAFTPEVSRRGLHGVAEVHDGDAPHRAGGCLSQAWSVGELLAGFELARPGPLGESAFA